MRHNNINIFKKIITKKKKNSKICHLTNELISCLIKFHIVYLGINEIIKNIAIH